MYSVAADGLKEFLEKIQDSNFKNFNYIVGDTAIISKEFQLEKTNNIVTFSIIFQTTEKPLPLEFQGIRMLISDYIFYYDENKGK